MDCLRSGLSSTDKAIGQTQDAFTITHRPDGSRLVTEGVDARATTRTRRAAYGRPVALDVAVHNPATPDGDGPGTVTVLKQGGVLASGMPGIVRIPARGLAVGNHRLTVRWSGNDSTRGGSTTVQQRVVKAPSSVTVLGTRLPGRAGRTKGRVSVRVAAAGVATTGRVVVRAAGRKFGTATWVKGRATVSLRGLPRRKVRLIVRYLGSPTATPTTGRLRLAPLTCHDGPGGMSAVTHTMS